MDQPTKMPFEISLGKVPAELKDKEKPYASLLNVQGKEAQRPYKIAGMFGMNMPNSNSDLSNISTQVSNEVAKDKISDSLSGMFGNKQT